MKLIKLTNAHAEYKGKALILNTDLIASFYESEDADGNVVVVAYGVHGNTWNVMESIEDILMATA